MTPQEIFEYNKRCAEFLGIEKFKDLLAKLHSGNISISKDVYEQSLFHSDWNWIMEVVKAIEKIGYNVVIGKTHCSMWIGGTVYSGSNKNCDTKEEAVVQAINNFLIWYNNEIQTNKQSN